MSYKAQQQNAYFKGLKAEELFCKLTGAVKGSQQDDYNHIDVRLDGVTYDIKSVKQSMSKGWVLVELKNVQGKSGWCSKTGVNKIAFMDESGFMIVDNAKLYVFTQKLMIANAQRGGYDVTSVLREGSAHRKYGYDTIKYKAIGRPNRKDVFVYIPKEDLLTIVEKTYAIK